MVNFSIREKCKINTNIDTDTFVGIKCEDDDLSIHFPIGFRLSDDDKELRKDILLLMNTISSTVGRKESEIKNKSSVFNCVGFPFQAYLVIIHDYCARGYYKEIELQYNVCKKGKIDWNRTIKTQKSFVQNNDVFYLDFVTKKNLVKEDELITQIHKYCVYDAFEKIGWLFTSSMPAKPQIKFNIKTFRSVLRDKLLNTFNDRNRLLFKSMLAIVEYLDGEKSSRDYKYGTYRFEYVWEMLIDKVYGIRNKEDYYPKTTWNFETYQYNVRDEYENSSLRPDSIMLYDGDVYVLDAKYYKYGVIRNPALLPKSTDINKQITYGEYIAEQNKFKKIHGKNYKVYNAFIMPFDAIKSGSESVLRIGQAMGNWKSGMKEYEKVQGILIDVKHLMKIGVRNDYDEITQLAKSIKQYV